MTRRTIATIAAATAWLAVEVAAHLYRRRLERGRTVAAPRTMNLWKRPPVCQVLIAKGHRATVTPGDVFDVHAAARKITEEGDKR